MPDSNDLWTYEFVREGEDNILRVDAEKSTKVPSIEDDESVMAKACEKLIENPSTTKIVFSQKRDYEYDYPQVVLLLEIAQLYNRLVKHRELFSFNALKTTGVQVDTAAHYNEIHNVLFNALKKDPVGCYIEIKRILRKEKIKLDHVIGDNEYQAQNKYISLLAYVLKLLENTKLITISKPYIAGHKAGDRSVYLKIFSPSIKPDFMFTKLMAQYPKKGIELANYSVGDTEVVIFEIPDSVQYLYHITPPEFKLTEEKYELLDLARKIIMEHKPTRQEFIDPERMREVFYYVGKDLLEELANYKNIMLGDEEFEDLAQILLRYTVGFGLIEVLLRDQKIQDIAVNSPYGQNPLFCVHQDFDECKTNIIPTISDAESWASKLRLMSGRPLDEANPILDTEIVIPNIASARVSVITAPLDPHGKSYSFRRQRDEPWTFPLFLKNKMMSPLAAGLLSFFIDGNRTILVAGTRGSGKTSFLGSTMIEMMRRYRIITIDDTLELPTTHLRKLGYNIVPMQVASALARESSEFTATEGIRSTLRLGDSAIYVGEVRSKEAIALFEAMRVGAGANVVAGTFHADSPFGIYDRCVNAIGIPNTSFKALDLAVIINPIRSADGLHKWRRVTKITEVRKDWKQDPLMENGFVDLMVYKAETDQLEPTDALINGDCELIKSIAGNIKEWAGNWNVVWENILLRAKIKERIVTAAKEAKDDELLEARFVILANDQFHKISEHIKKKKGELDTDEIFFEWDEWLKKEIKKKKLGKDKD
ncbi:MAG: type II/IV secretion system ATPase subunit [Candidatus Woesearchaeota archaeon]